MTDAGQYIGTKQPHRFQRLISAETGPGETEVDDSNSGGLVEVGDLLNHLVGAAAKLQRAEGEADSTLVGRGILAVGLGAHCNRHRRGRGWDLRAPAAKYPAERAPPEKRAPDRRRF